LQLGEDTTEPRQLTASTTPVVNVSTTTMSGSVLRAGFDRGARTGPHIVGMVVSRDRSPERSGGVA